MQTTRRYARTLAEAFPDERASSGDWDLFYQRRSPSTWLGDGRSYRAARLHMWVLRILGLLAFACIGILLAWRG